MSDSNSHNLTNPDLWIRLIYMVLFAVLSGLSRIVILIIAALQFLLVLFNGTENQNLKKLGFSTAQWTRDSYDFLTFNSDNKPFPFSDWPEPLTETETKVETTDDQPENIPTLTDEVSDEK